MSNSFENQCFESLIEEDDAIRKMRSWETGSSLETIEELLGSGDANKKRALFHQFYTEIMDTRILELQEQIKSLEDDYIGDFASYLNDTFNPRIKAL